MVILNGKNLGERHKELNMKVNEAALNNVDFELIKNNTEKSDVDKLFKIDLASKSKNIEYIIEVLTSGDPLHISRALKCVWMYEDQFSNFINVEYLQRHVFPFMSLKMKKKLLKSISTYLRNENRAVTFYDYCMDVKFSYIAYKFLIFTNDDFKLKYMEKYPDMINKPKGMCDLKYFIGNSFALADAYLSTFKWLTSKLEACHTISYLYSISDLKYLDLLEKHVQFNELAQMSMPRLGLRISKNIIKKYENRVIMHPTLYIVFLNKTSITKYITPDNAKKCITALFPKEANKFWDNNFCYHCEYVINILPAEERFDFLKKIFNDKFPDQPFEMSSTFYSQKNYRFMTVEQKSKWALDQIASQNEILGTGNDYQWYKFIKFDIAFDEVKKLVMNTPDRNQRNAIVKILIESAKTQRDLEKLFNYYNARHNNEQSYNKEKFIDELTYNHNVYEFDKNCWDAFNEILENLDVYSLLDLNRGKCVYKIISLIYHVINKIDVHEALKLYINNNVQFYILKRQLNKLTKDKQNMVYQYLLNFYMDKINELGSVTYDDEVKSKFRQYIHNVLDVLRHNEKTKSDIPEAVMTLMQLDWDEFKRHQLLYEPTKNTTQEDLMRLLKQDAQLVVENLPLVRKSMEAFGYRLYFDQLLKKLKIYFSNDISQVYLNFYKDILNEGQLRSYMAQPTCLGIFLLADNSFKVDFMTKYAPTQVKINRSKINENLLNIQEAICSTAFYSRPPVPLKNIVMYVKGDYVPNCLPMFNYYSANLPLPFCMEFIEAMLNNPISIQKHGLRLAFAYFETENLRELVLKIWNKCKNISLRLLIYKALYNKILEDANAQTTLFETLKIFTLDLQKDDSQDLFTHWRFRKLPQHLMSDYISTMWKALNALPDSKMTCTHKVSLIEYMARNIETIRKDIIQSIVQEFVKSAFDTEDSMKSSLKSTELNKSKWDLITYYIMFVQNQDDLETKLELAKLILTECSRRYNLVDENKYIMRKFCSDFIYKLLQQSSMAIYKSNEYVNEMLEAVLELLQALFSIDDIYMLMWPIRIDLILNKALLNINTSLQKVDNDAEKRAIIRTNFLIVGTKVGTLFKEFMEKDIYYPIFLPNIQNVLIAHVKSAPLYVRGFEIKLDDLLVIICVALLELKINEMFALALNILPTQCSVHFEEDYKQVLNVLKGVSPELRCKIYDKFLCSDFEVRPFLQL